MQEKFNYTKYFCLACISAVAVANIYYCQPLLKIFTDSFPTESCKVGYIATAVQIAYALGLLFFVPLGDKLAGRTLLIIIFFLNAIAAGAATLSKDINQLLVAHFIIGLTAIGAQIIIPMASLMAPHTQKGKAVGIILSGLMTGILFGRIFAGIIGEHLGWRAVYGFSCIFDLIAILVIPFLLPLNKHTQASLSYFQLQKSLVSIFFQESLLRKACFSGALMFFALSSVWGALAFLLAKPPYQYGSSMVGVLGLTGIAGILLSPYIGFLSDRYAPRLVFLLGCLLAGGGFSLLYFAKNNIIFIVLSLIAFDIGGRTGLICNQLRAFSLAENSRSRINTVFMFCYFIGGAMGTKFGQVISQTYSWLGILWLGLIVILTAALINVGKDLTYI